MLGISWCLESKHQPREFVFYAFLEDDVVDMYFVPVYVCVFISADRVRALSREGRELQCLLFFWRFFPKRVHAVFTNATQTDPWMTDRPLDGAVHSSRVLGRGRIEQTYKKK